MQGKLRKGSLRGEGWLCGGREDWALLWGMGMLEREEDWPKCEEGDGSEVFRGVREKNRRIDPT